MAKRQSSHEWWQYCCPIVVREISGDVIVCPVLVRCNLLVASAEGIRFDDSINPCEAWDSVILMQLRALSPPESRFEEGLE